MDADWYEDPLGRYDGRFFDGENWTARVSADGVLETDDEFPAAPAVSPVAPAPQPEAARSARPEAGTESPVRVVAVVDESLVDDRPTASPKGARQREKQRRLARMMLALLVGLALLVFAIDFFTRSDLDQSQTDRVEDLEAGSAFDGDLEDLDIDQLEVDAPEGAVDPRQEFDPSETIEIGSLNIVNGSSALANLVDWHQRYTDGRGIALGPDAGCWFGQLGGAAVQVAHCGPVAGSADTEYLFDLVPVNFVDVENGQLAQPVVDAVTPDTVIANAVTLIGSADGPAAPDGLTQTRGERGNN